MAQNLNDPQRVAVTTEISFEEALQAIEHYAGKYPVERLSYEHINRLAEARAILVYRFYNQAGTEGKDNG